MLILNFNGKEHLDHCLTTALRASQNALSPVSVVLVDNHSIDGSVDYVRQNYPEVEVIVAPNNDFLFSYNIVANERPEDILLLLNNDMKFNVDFLEPLIKHFYDPSVFAVTCKILNWDGTQVTEARRVGKVERWWFYKGFDFSKQDPCYSMAACGGAAAFRRDMFLRLRGFDPLYQPGYYEDFDLSYRAWKRGWKTIYEPGSLVYHRVSASFNASRSKAVKRILARNHILFTTKNIGEWRFLIMFLLLLPIRIIKHFIFVDNDNAVGELFAISRIPSAILGRIKGNSSKQQLLTDKQIVSFIQ
jgi:GT2 family glycosyltransferase